MPTWSPPSPVLQVLQPSLEEVQTAVSQVVQCVTDIGQSIPSWVAPSFQSPQISSSHSEGLWQLCLHTVCVHMFLAAYMYNELTMRGNTACDCSSAAARPVQPSNYHRAIHDSKEVLKLTSLLSSAILAYRQDLMKVLC